MEKRNFKSKETGRMTKSLLYDRNTLSGITLVALVVTIVVLLILAGITITYVMGDNSIFKLAQEAKDKTEQAKKDEQNHFNSLGNMINEQMNGNNENTSTAEFTVTIVYDKNDETILTVKEGTRVGEILPEAPTKPGYTFKGWYSDDGQSVDVDTIITSNMTIRASWVRIS